MSEKIPYTEIDEHEVMTKVREELAAMSYGRKVTWYKAVSIPGAYDILVNNTNGNKKLIEEQIDKKLRLQALEGVLSDLQNGYFRSYNQSVEYANKKDLNPVYEERYKDSMIKGLFNNWPKEYEEITRALGHELGQNDIVYNGNSVYKVGENILVSFDHSPEEINIQYTY